VFHTIFNVVGVIIMLPLINILERGLLKFFKDSKDKDIDEPKFLNKSILKFPGSVISALINESKYLYKNAVFEIVAHGLNIHRGDIKSDAKVNDIVKKSREVLNINVEDVYYKKVKNIYGEIIKYATTAEKELKLSDKEITTILDIKIANRRMIEIIKHVRELNKNIILSFDNKYMRKEYDGFRKKITKVLRIIYLFRKSEDSEVFAEKLVQLKKEAKENMRFGNSSIDRLIRKDLINAEMASSLFNDFANVNKIIEKLIQVAELLYGKKDTLLDNDN
jgi:phosphate:Na+ symporter